MFVLNRFVEITSMFLSPTGPRQMQIEEIRIRNSKIKTIKWTEDVNEMLRQLRELAITEKKKFKTKLKEKKPAN